jgi:hypothetical protein
MTRERKTRTLVRRRTLSMIPVTLLVLSLGAGAHAMPAGVGSSPPELLVYVPIGAPSNMDELQARVAARVDSHSYVPTGAPQNMKALRAGLSRVDSHSYVPTGAPENMDALQARVATEADSHSYVPTGAPENMDALQARVAHYGMTSPDGSSNLARVRIPTAETEASGSAAVDGWDTQDWFAAAGVVAASLLAVAIGAVMFRSRVRISA